jgi:hypothetical protein
MPRRGQFGATALAMLGMLERCPWLPADVLGMLVGVRNPRSLARSLLRLREAGLVASRRARLGRLLAGGRPMTLWTATAAGLTLLPASVAAPSGEAGCPDRRARRWQGATLDLVRLVASYRLLSRAVAMFAAAGTPVRLRAWEAPWVRHDRAGRRVAFPAGATLETGGASSLALLLPDLGTAPVGRARPAVGRLLRLLEEQAAGGTPSGTTPLLVIGCPDPDGAGGRARAWRELVARAAQRAGMIAPELRVITWDARGPEISYRRGSSVDRLLDLVGRHPCLTREQLAALLDTSPAGIRRIERQLTARGWVRPIAIAELPAGALGLGPAGLRALGLLEPTPAGRRELARRVALPGAVAARQHGLIGGERGRAGKRRRALRTLAHTLGANAIFVGLVLAARAVRQGGGDDRLEAWWCAAAHERRRCRPDGYGWYRRASSGYGFLLEYDRGTERADQLARKFAAYARYRDRGEAAHHFTSFPTILVVATSVAAEQRLAEAAFRVWWRQQGEPLPVLLTTTQRILAHREGILGPVWRTPARADRRYWLPGGPPRGLFGIGRPAVRTPQLAWVTP